jgi:hypothetical protein
MGQTFRRSRASMLQATASSMGTAEALSMGGVRQGKRAGGGEAAAHLSSPMQLNGAYHEEGEGPTVTCFDWRPACQ